jgi:hypothetical protein
LAEVWPEQFVALVFLASFVSLATDRFNAQGKLTLARHSHAAMLGLFGGVGLVLLVGGGLVLTVPDTHWMFF